MCETHEARIVGFNWRGKILDIRNFLPVILIIKYFIVTRPLPVAEEGSAQNWQKPNEGGVCETHEARIVGFNWMVKTRRIVDISPGAHIYIN